MVCFWEKSFLILDLVKLVCYFLKNWVFNSHANYVLGFEADLINKKNFFCIGVSVVRWQLFDWFYSLTLFRKCVACCEAWLVNLVYWQTWFEDIQVESHLKTTVVCGDQSYLKSANVDVFNMIG